MKNYVNRFSPAYLTTLVYMLQTTEYNLAEYVRWLRRTKNFKQVVKRKSLVRTTKAKAILSLLWAMAGLGVILAGALVWIWLVSGQIIWLILALLEVVLAPWLLAYGVILPISLGQWLIQKPQERKIIAAAKQKLAQHKGLRIAIAGSYGKTTMKETLQTILMQGKKVAATPGNKNTPLGISQFVSTLTGDEEVLIFELGEYLPGDIRKLCELVQPNVGIITGINEAHLEKFKTLEVTTQTIFDLAKFLGDKPTYKNGENKLVKTKVGESDPLLYTRDGVNGWTVSDAMTSLHGTSFVAKKTQTTGPVTIHAQSGLLGLHQIGPLMVCIDIATSLGLSVQQIEKGIQATKPFEHRLQPHFGADGVITLDDTYNGNPDGVTAGLEFLTNLKNHRLVYVTPGLVEAGSRVQEVHEQIGRQLAQAKIDLVVLVENSVTPHIQTGLQAAGFQGKLMTFPDALTCLAALPNLTKDGDVVLMQNDWPDSYA